MVAVVGVLVLAWIVATIRFVFVPTEDDPGNGHARQHRDGALLSETDERGNDGHVQAGEGEDA